MIKMQKYLQYIVLLAVCSVPASTCQATEIAAVRIDSTAALRYGKFEVEFDLSEAYDNPFDPDEIDAALTVIPPSGDTLSVPAFWYQAYERSNTGTDEILAEVGDACWMARFGPSELGLHLCAIEVTDSAGYIHSDDFTFVCGPSASRGFIRPDAADPRLFTFDDGSHYLPRGENVSWATNLGTYDYDMYFDEMEAGGQNWTRIWMTHFYRGQTLEWNESHWTGYFHGLGIYSLECAWKLDYIVESAREKGIYLQLVTQHHGQFSTAVNPEWNENPYAVANGGMLSSPEQFFTDAEARDLYKQKMRYTVARWGYSTSVLCWELWNEAQYTDNYSPSTVAAWHAEMGQHIRSIDPGRHMLTTSVRRQDSIIWALPEIDCTQLHLYVGEITQTVRDRVVSMCTYEKPVIVGEFGYYPHQTGWDDTDGTHIHNGIWSAAMSMTGAMCWWWDNYIHPNDLYYHWEGLSAFFEAEDLRYPSHDTLHVAVTGARGFAVGDSICACVWVQDPGNTIGGVPEDTLSGVSLEIPGMSSGDYDIEYWNTFSGTMTAIDLIACSDDTLRIAVPDFSLDIAVKVKRHDRAGVLTPEYPEAAPATRFCASPNPVFYSTTLRLEPPSTGRVEMRIYDVTGRLVWQRRAEGGSSVEWHGRNMDGIILPSGVYFCRATTALGEHAAKIVILRPLL